MKILAKTRHRLVWWMVSAVFVVAAIGFGLR